MILKQFVKDVLIFLLSIITYIYLNLHKFFMLAQECLHIYLHKYMYILYMCTCVYINVLVIYRDFNMHLRKLVSDFHITLNLCLSNQDSVPDSQTRLPITIKNKKSWPTKKKKKKIFHIIHTSINVGNLQNKGQKNNAKNH